MMENRDSGVTSSEPPSRQVSEPGFKPLSAYLQIQCSFLNTVEERVSAPTLPFSKSAQSAKGCFHCVFSNPEFALFFVLTQLLTASCRQWWHFRHGNTPVLRDLFSSWHTSLVFQITYSKRGGGVRSALSQQLGFLCKNEGYGLGADAIPTVSQSLTPLQISGLKLFPFLKWGG